MNNIKIEKMIKKLKKNLRKKITRVELEKFIFKHRSDKYTLDIGAKNSPYGKYFKNRVGFDVFEGVGVDVVGDAHNLPFENKKFDVILCTEVLEHLHTPEKVISEMKRVLKKGGTLILTTRFVFPIHDAPYDYYRYTKYGLKHLFSEWEIIELREDTGVTETLAILLQEIALQKKMSKKTFAKGFLFLLSKLLVLFSLLTKEAYKNNVNKNVQKECILTSGYYLVCKKR